MTIRPLNPQLAEKACKELNEDPNKVQADIQALKEWLLKQPHLKCQTDDQWLLLFLRGCKFSLERAKKKFDLFYSCRTAMPEFQHVKPTEPLFMEIFNLGVLIPLPKTWAPDAPVVTIFRVGAYDPNKYNIMDIMAVTDRVQKVLIYDNDNASVAGVQSIVDMEGSTMSHYLQISPLQLKKIIVAFQDAWPLRLKGSHYLNTPSTFETIFNLMKSFLNEKSRSRLFVHNKSYEEMYKVIPKHILPVEYGGSGGTIPEILDYWKKKLTEYSSWLEEGDKCGVDESKRPGKPKTVEELFGVDGSFRQLEFD